MVKQAALWPGCITVTLHGLHEELWGSDEMNLDNAHLKDFYPSSHLPAIKQGSILACWPEGCPIPDLGSVFLRSFWFSEAFCWQFNASLPVSFFHVELQFDLSKINCKQKKMPSSQHRPICREYKIRFLSIFYKLCNSPHRKHLVRGKKKFFVYPHYTDLLKYRYLLVPSATDVQKLTFPTCDRELPSSSIPVSMVGNITPQ